MTETVFVTGANRGIGLEFCRQYAQEGANVFACCRNPDSADELQALQQQYPNLKIKKLDVSSKTDREALQKEITDPIDILINNAGIIEDKEEALGNLSTEKFNKTFLINSIAPIKITETFLPNIKKGKRRLVACLSSSMGSISENSSGGYYSYRASKAALNMIMRSAAIDLLPHQIKVLLLHPGWVKTRMGGEEATLSPQESVQGMRQVIAQYAPTPGEVRFHRYNGEIIPW